MTIKEVVIKVENRPGELARIVGHLYENDVKVSAFWVGTENEKATLRFVTSDPDSALSVLTGLGFKPTTSDAIAARVPDHPGGLNTLLMILRSAEINILHIYPCLETQDPILILEVDNTEAAVKALKSNWINLCDERLYYM